jgi:hypothetical protein
VEISRYLLTRKPGGQSDPLFLTLGSPFRPLTYFALRQVLERINDRLGTNISWHDLRHTFTHRLLDDNGLGLSDVQQLLRHRDLSTLAAYSTSRVDELVKHLRAHGARPKPELSAADGYGRRAEDVISGLDVSVPWGDRSMSAGKGRRARRLAGAPVPAAMAVLPHGDALNMSRPELEPVATEMVLA